jgi:hypothetical protein
LSAGSTRRLSSPLGNTRSAIPDGTSSTGRGQKFKSFALGEHRHIQFRAEAFNAFNTPQFNNPNAQIGFSGVARITSAGNPTVFQRTPRQVQLALKFYF